jgi:hypothetical protein
MVLPLVPIMIFREFLILGNLAILLLLTCSKRLMFLDTLDTQVPNQIFPLLAMQSHAGSSLLHHHRVLQTRTGLEIMHNDNIAPDVPLTRLHAFCGRPQVYHLLVSHPRRAISTPALICLFDVHLWQRHRRRLHVLK